MADVILIQPNIGNWDNVRSHPSIPLAIMSASRLLAKEFSLVLIDQRTDRDWRSSLTNQLDKKPICVGITSMTGNQISHAIEAAKIVKNNSKVPVVWGGIHPTLMPQMTIESDYADFVVKGEGEITFLELVKSLAADKKSLIQIKGLWRKENGKVIANADRGFCSLDELPELPYDLVDLKKYLPKFKGLRTMYFETSRGCPNRCAFCYNQIYHASKWRPMSSEKVLYEIKKIVNDFGIRSFYLIDDNFFVDLARFRQIAEGLIREKIDIIWEAQGITIQSAVKMNEDDIDLMEKSGCRKLHFGIESGSEKILRAMKKNLNIADVLDVNIKFKEHDIVLQYNFMAGFPHETRQDIKKTVDLIWKITCSNPNAIISPICPYTPYPGTELFKQAESDGFMKKGTLTDWSNTDYGDNIWSSPKKSRFLNSLFFSSMFLDVHRLKDMLSNPIYKLLVYLYRPIARARVKKLFFRFMPELIFRSLMKDE